MKIYLLAILLLASSAWASHQKVTHAPHRADPRPCIGGGCEGEADRDRQNYGQSGTRGRMGLGADPRSPEGPGNASN